MSLLPFRASRVVKALPESVLPSGLKLLFLEMYGLDNAPGGCAYTAAFIAKRLGVSPRTVDDGRRKLEQLGLIYHGSEGWHLTVPTDCVPSGEVVADPAIQAAAQKLADYLQPRRNNPVHQRGSEPSAPTPPRPPTGTVPVQQRGENPSTDGVEPVEQRGFARPESPSSNGVSEADPPRENDGPAPGGLERLEGEVKVKIQPAAVGSAHAPETPTANPGTPQRLKPNLAAEFGPKQRHPDG